MQFRFACAAVALAAGFVGSAAFAQENADVVHGEGVAAIVNDEVISTYDVKQRAALLVAGAGIQPTEEVLERARAQALRDLVDERLQIQEARENKIVIDPAELDRAVGNVARQNGGSIDALDRQLASSGAGIGTLRTQLEADLAWRRLINGRYGSRVRISDRQVRETLARVRANVSKPQYLVSEILIPAESESELAQAEQIAARLLQEIRNGAPFPGVARQFSASATAAAGGDLGWLAQGELPRELQTVVDQLSPGQASRPVRGPGGVYIVALREKREGQDPASLSRVALQQISAPVSAREALERQLRRVEGCANAARAVEGVDGVQVTDLGELKESELSDDMRRRIADVQIGGVTGVAQTGEAVAAFVVCDRQASGEGMPSAAETEDRLYEQELAMLAQRYLRNLRRESTIITR